MQFEPGSITAVQFGAIAALLAAAVLTDVRRHKIPNALTIAGLAAGCALGFAASGLAGLGHAASGAAVGLALLLPGYLLRAMGGGDVKLMAAVGSYLGPTTAALACALTLVAGGVLAFLVVTRRKVTDRADADMGASSASMSRARRFPYAGAIATGTVLALAIGLV